MVPVALVERSHQPDLGFVRDDEIDPFSVQYSVWQVFFLYSFQWSKDRPYGYTPWVRKFRWMDFSGWMYMDFTDRVVRQLN
jgi:hypothetical protein